MREIIYLTTWDPINDTLGGVYNVQMTSARSALVTLFRTWCWSPVKNSNASSLTSSPFGVTPSPPQWEDHMYLEPCHYNFKAHSQPSSVYRQNQLSKSVVLHFCKWLSEKFLSCLLKWVLFSERPEGFRPLFWPSHNVRNVTYIFSDFGVLAKTLLLAISNGRNGQINGR